MIVGTSAASARLSELVRRVLAGGEVVRAGKPVARRVPFSPGARPRWPGALRGKSWIAPDFDALPDDIAEAFGMRER